MARYNTKTVAPRAPRVKSYISTSEASTTETYNGGAGFERDAKSELFLLGVSSFNEDMYYESASLQMTRVKELVSKVLESDDGVAWLAGFTKWLRADANIRSMSIAIALATAKTMIDQGVTGSRSIVSNVLQRSDEPAEAIGFWYTNYGRKLPQPVKRGIADAAKRLYNERSVFKYDSDSKAIRFADVIQLVHPDPSSLKQSAVFKFALDRRYNDKALPTVKVKDWDGKIVEFTLNVAAEREKVKSLGGVELRKLANEGKLTEYLKSSGMTWESLSSIIDGGMDAKAWEAVIPTMGYMALLRNLRNFLNAGVSTEVLDQIAARIADPDEVAKSKQLPFRFWSAYKETEHSNQFSLAIERAFDASLVNVPALSGRTLILVDMSGSMWGRMSAKSDLMRCDAAALFGAALAKRADDASLVRFGTESEAIKFTKSMSVLKLKDKLTKDSGGTDLGKALTKHYKGHDRVIILTDEQYNPSFHGYWNPVDPSTIVPDKPIFVWNLAGYEPAGMGQPNVYVSGGLSDAAFGFIDMVERSMNHDWPWSDNK